MIFFLLLVPFAAGCPTGHPNQCPPQNLEAGGCGRMDQMENCQDHELPEFMKFVACGAVTVDMRNDDTTGTLRLSVLCGTKIDSTHQLIFVNKGTAIYHLDDINFGSRGVCVSCNFVEQYAMSLLAFNGTVINDATCFYVDIGIRNAVVS